MTKKIFELDVILSLAHNTCILEVAEEDICELMEHVIGRKIEDHEYGEIQTTVSAYLIDKYPKIKEAVKLTSYVLPDHGRYSKLIDLCKKNHEIESMQKQSVKQSEEAFA